ncbi:MAG: hypothetical protein R2795_20780 [Saprospiraceae bacterium]
MKNTIHILLLLLLQATQVNAQSHARTLGHKQWEQPTTWAMY